MLAFLFDFYHVLFVIFAYSLLNLAVSLLAHFRKKNTPGNNYVYIGTLFLLVQFHCYSFTILSR